MSKTSLKPRRMWTELPQLFTAIPQVFHQKPCPTAVHPDGAGSMPVLVIPLTEECVDALTRKVALDICHRHSFGQSWLGCPEATQERYLEEAGAALAAIGIKVPGRVKGRKRCP
jgi:hypothetical protein